MSNEGGGGYEWKRPLLLAICRKTWRRILRHGQVDSTNKDHTLKGIKWSLKFNDDDDE